MGRTSSGIMLAVIVVILACAVQLTLTSPIKWGKVHLSPEQEETVAKVDELLNQFLTQLEMYYKIKPQTLATEDSGVKDDESGEDKTPPGSSQVQDLTAPVDGQVDGVKVPVSGSSQDQDLTAPVDGQVDGVKVPVSGSGQDQDLTAPVDGQVDGVKAPVYSLATENKKNKPVINLDDSEEKTESFVGEKEASSPSTDIKEDTLTNSAEVSVVIADDDSDEVVNYGEAPIMFPYY